MTDDATRSSASSAQNTNSHPDDSSTTIYTHERNTRDQGLSDETTESTSTETPSTNQHKLLNYYRERFPSFDLQSGEPANKSEELLNTMSMTEKDASKATSAHEKYSSDADVDEHTEVSAMGNPAIVQPRSQAARTSAAYKKFEGWKPTAGPARRGPTASLSGG
ncbi:uncharacterized protein L201_001709 [Kwoniella dendrophila CBS 6074]|uniref:Uncharacterized protein n=1 Tax=Kwoniella dendrophila CBS 6074 TaxID=1295534 RepID=A0AAX4JN34_9TREE